MSFEISDGIAIASAALALVGLAVSYRTSLKIPKLRIRVLPNSPHRGNNQSASTGSDQ